MPKTRKRIENAPVGRGLAGNHSKSTVFDWVTFEQKAGKTIPPLLLLVSFLLLLFGVASMLISFHNIDQAHDLTIMSYETGVKPSSWVLCYDSGKCDSFFNVYSHGILSGKAAFGISILSSMMVGLSMGVLLISTGNVGGSK